MPIDPQTEVGAVRLAVADLDRVRRFYDSVIGLTVIESSEREARLGADGVALVELVADPGGAPRPRGTTGLFHLAVLLPDRPELARALRRLADSRWPLAGASDHLVSEALYLGDPEGNGIELYRDRPREDWRRTNGGLEMATLPLDLESLAADADRTDGTPGAVADATRIGHVHLHVADLGPAEEFYAGTLGFEVTVRDYPGALFLSAGGYHHHIGLNTWAGEGAPPPPPGSLGLRRFEVVVPDDAELDRVRGRLSDAGIEPEADGGGVLAADPSGNRVLVRSAASG
jgi:catechol 2,3-dioxygenase